MAEDACGIQVCRKWRITTLQIDVPHGSRCERASAATSCKHCQCNTRRGLLVAETFLSFSLQAKGSADSRRAGSPASARSPAGCRAAQTAGCARSRAAASPPQPDKKKARFRILVSEWNFHLHCRSGKRTSIESCSAPSQDAGAAVPLPDLHCHHPHTS